MVPRRLLFLALVLAALGGVAIWTFYGRPAAAQAGCDRFVLGTDGSDATDCGDETHPCRTIQHAIDQSVVGDVICVAKDVLAGPLVYAETLEISQTVTLDGAWRAGCTDPSDLTCSFTSIPCDPANVTVDAGGTGRAITIDGSASPGTAAPVIQCLTVTGGDANGLGGDPELPTPNDAGGGIYSVDAAPIIANSVITGNYGCNFCSTAYGRGGGIYLLRAPASSSIHDNVIAHNVADESTWGIGGGVMLRDSEASVSNNVIEWNRAGHSAGDGGGIAVRDGAPTVSGNQLTHNVGGQAVQGLGGGIYVWSSGAVTLTNNTLRYNKAISGTGNAVLRSSGGGIHVIGDPSIIATIRDNVIDTNIASPLTPQVGLGGGLYVDSLSTGSEVSGNTIMGNVAGFNGDGNGGGIYAIHATVVVTGNTVVDNAATWAGSHGEGGGIYTMDTSGLIATNVITGNAGGYFPGSPSTATGYGGGIAAYASLTFIDDNLIANNDGTRGDNWAWGGGVYVEGGQTQVAGNTIVGNTACPAQFCFGGGVAVTGTVSLIRDNWIVSNTTALDLFGAGGGVFLGNGTHIVAANTISDNLASVADFGFGGGVYAQFDTVTLERNTILDNVASPGEHSYGGAVRIAAVDVFTMTNNIIARNAASASGSGVDILGGNGVMANNTIVDNQATDSTGVAVGTNSAVTLINTLIADQAVGIRNTAAPTSTVTADTTLFDGVTTPVIDVTNLNPLPGPAALLPNYHLGPGSNAIDHGLTLTWVMDDIDGNTRPQGSGYDVGADEAIFVYLPLVLKQ